MEWEDNTGECMPNRNGVISEKKNLWIYWVALLFGGLYKELRICIRNKLEW